VRTSFANASSSHYWSLVTLLKLWRSHPFMSPLGLHYGTAELTQQAAVLVNPGEMESIADGMRCVVMDRGLREQLVGAGGLY
jgi:hypothetical protein